MLYHVTVVLYHAVVVLYHAVVVLQLSVKVLPGLLLIRCSSLGVQYLFVQSLYHGVVLHQAFVVRHQGLPVVHHALIMML